MKQPQRDHLTGHKIVWIAQLSQAKNSLATLEAWLDERDRERAARFHLEADRGRFVLGRALIRKSLGHYLGQAPASIELAYTDLRRPFFPHDDSIQFSISHTQDLVALALTQGARIGIDLEVMKNLPDLTELAERIFSPADLAKFQSLSTSEKLAAFYRTWTRKEAYLKARGEGITDGLQQISVSLGAEETVPVEDSRHPVSETWHLITLPVPATYAGTLACDGPSRRLEGSFVRFDQDELVSDASF